MVMLVTENELLSAKTDRVGYEGRLTWVRENGDIIDAGIAVGSAVTDAGIASIAADPESAFAGQLSATMGEDRESALSTLTVQALTGDTSSADAWERAIDRAQTFGIRRVIGPDDVYEFDRPVSLSGVGDIVLEGHSRNGTSIKAKTGAGQIAGAFEVRAGDLPASDVTLRNLRFDGGLTNASALEGQLARSARTFSTDRLLTALNFYGDRLPTGVNPNIENLSIIDCDFIGMQELPVYVGGVSGWVRMEGCRTWRCMDPGFTYCEAVSVIGNRFEWSADNGVSVSRGCENVVITGNLSHGSYNWGLWAAGFFDSVGPKNVSITGNTVTSSGLGGICLTKAPVNVTVTGNTVSGVAYRDADGGIGIQVEGDFDSGAWADGITVASNTVVDCARGGILVRELTRNVLIDSNMVIRPGSEFDAAGGSPDLVSGFYNFGVSVGHTSSDVSNGLVGRVVVQNNITIDDRPVPRAAWGTFQRSGTEALVMRAGNLSWGTTNPENSVLRRLMKLELGVGDATGYDFGPLQATPDMLRLRALDGTTWRDAFTVNRTTAQTTFVRPPKVPSYATGSRPTASAQGAGAMIYDSTLNKPLWSTGTAWVDASGATV